MFDIFYVLPDKLNSCRVAETGARGARRASDLQIKSRIYRFEKKEKKGKEQKEIEKEKNERENKENKED